MHKMTDRQWSPL